MLSAIIYSYIIIGELCFLLMGMSYVGSLIEINKECNTKALVRHFYVALLIGICWAFIPPVIIVAILIERYKKI